MGALGWISLRNWAAGSPAAAGRLTWAEMEVPDVVGTTGQILRYGLRGTYVTFDIVISDICGQGVELDGIEIEGEVVQESQNKITYDPFDESGPWALPFQTLFLGEYGGNDIFQAGTGFLDNDQAYTVRARPNVMAPAGPGGEAIFQNLYLLLKRWNTDTLTLTITPYVDGVALEVTTVQYAATTAPILEPVEIPLTVPILDSQSNERGRVRARGTWFTFELTTPSGSQITEVMVVGAEVEGEVVQESKDHVN